MRAMIYSKTDRVRDRVIDIIKSSLHVRYERVDGGRQETKDRV